MGYSVGRNTRLEVESTLDSARTITAITKAATSVATAAAHGYINGDIVSLINIQGMSELDGQIIRAANITTNTFDLEGIDTTLFGTFTSGTAQKISVWATVSNSTSVSAGSPAKDWLESTTLLDSEKQYLPGFDDTPELTVNVLTDPFIAAMIKIETAARLGNALGFRMTLSDNTRRVFRGFPTMPNESIEKGAITSGSFNIRQIKRRLAFVS